MSGAGLDPDTLTYWPAAHASDEPDIRAALDRHAHHQAATEHPEDATRLDQARQARVRSETATNAYYQLYSELLQRSHQPIYDTGAAETITDLTQRVTAAQQRVEQADQRAEHLYRDPAITSHPDPTTLLATEQTAWLEDTIALSRLATAHAHEPIHSIHSIEHETYQQSEPEHDDGISR